MNTRRQDERNYKMHRRMSSVFQPEQPSLLERTATTFSRAAEPFQRLNHRRVAQSDEREIRPNCHEPLELHDYELQNSRLFCDNMVTTTKYSVVTFLPKNLYEQFHRLANAYFVMIAAMNWIPWFGAFNKFVGMIPVAIILVLTAIKDLVEDFRRHRLDNEVNARFCHVWDRHANRFRKIEWKNIKVGDFVHLSVDEIIPADILLIRSSDANGIAFVETSNLDGETSLKQRRVPKSIINFSGESSGFKPPDFRTTILCEQPNDKIYQMVGKVIYEDGKYDSLCPENMLLRGCRVRNTTFVEGIVLYTGRDTKTCKNNTGPRYKRSSLELATNRFILYCVIILVVMCLFGGVASALWMWSFDSELQDRLIFITQISNSPIVLGLINLASSIINYQILIPLSLYISVELVKLGQLFFFCQDIEMYQEKTDTAMQFRSFNIPEELGQVQYIMSDKTGTLTENVMVFRRCSIGGVEYCQDVPYDAPPGDLRVDNITVSASLKRRFAEEYPFNQGMFDFFLNMAICNTVVVNKQLRVDSIEDGVVVQDGVFNTANSNFYSSPENSQGSSLSACVVALENIVEETGDEAADDEPPEKEVEEETKEKEEKKISLVLSPSSLPLRKLSSFSSFTKRLLSKRKRALNKREEVLMNTPEVYEAESPDELALVYAARRYGLKLVRKSLESMTLVTPDRDIHDVQILKVLPFDSKRKKMSIIIRSDDDIILFCKGADSEIFDSLSSNFKQSEYGARMWENSKQHLEKFSNAGLRTLCLAKKSLTHAEFEEWSLIHSQLESDVGLAGRDNKLAESLKRIESGLTLLGVTAIEDRLQDGVKEAIQHLREAGIQIWLLTGDKMATAINIARSCGLFPSVCDIHVIDNEDDVLEAYRCTAESGNQRPQCLVFTTRSLQLLGNIHVEKSRNACSAFLRCNPPVPTEPLLCLLELCTAVLCCRMTPSNKADIVQFAMQKLKGKVLAIGDGANDVSMIQVADVGVGLSGQEGMQAVMASDFALARFRFLEKLLLVHGHWSYDKLASTLLYFLYKNAMFVFVIFWCQIYNGFSGETPMDQFYMMMYPIIFTGAQPLLFGVYDQVADKETLLGNPRLYTVGRKRKLYRYTHFWSNIADALWQSAVTYFIAHYTYLDTDAGYYTFGFLLASSIFFDNMIHLAIEVHCWTVPMFVIFPFFVFVHYFYFFLEGAIIAPSWNLKDVPADVAIHAVVTSRYWGGLLLTVSLSLFPRLVIETLTNCLKPSAVFIESLRRRRNLVVGKPVENDV